MQLPRVGDYADLKAWAQELIRRLELAQSPRELAKRLQPGSGVTLGYSEATQTITLNSTGLGPTDLSYNSGTRLLSSSTGADVTLPLVASGTAGLAPQSGGGTTNFLRADGAWTTTPVTDLAYTASTRLLTSSTGADVTLPLVTTSNAGLAPASGGGTTNFLRADGTWAAPPGGGGGGSGNNYFPGGWA